MIDLMLVLTLVSWTLPLIPTDWPDEATNAILHISCIINLWVELTQNYLSNSIKWLKFTARFIANFASQVFMKIHPANFPFHPLEYCFVTTFLHGVSHHCLLTYGTAFTLMQAFIGYCRKWQLIIRILNVIGSCQRSCGDPSKTELRCASHSPNH